MNNKKKVILFLGAISLVVFGNYRQFVEKHKGKTTIEGKVSERATSSVGKNSKEGKTNEVCNLCFLIYQLILILFFQLM